MKLKYPLKILTILFLLLISLALSCEKVGYPKSSIGIINDYSHDIAFYVAIGGERGILYPDTTLPLNLNPPFPIARAGKTGYRDFGFSEEDIFYDIPSDTLSIYIFHPDTLSKYSWATVIQDYNILKRYDLSFEDLQRLDFNVTYPPDNSMAGIKMYPN